MNLITIDERPIAVGDVLHVVRVEEQAVVVAVVPRAASVVKANEPPALGVSVADTMKLADRPGG